MKKVQRHKKTRNRILATFAALTMALGVGVALGPKEAVMTEASSPLTLDNLGTNLGSEYSDDVQQTTVNEYVLNYKQGKKQGNSIILAKSSGAFISNKTPLPGKITSVEVFINSGAAAKTTYRVNFFNSEVLSDPASGTAVNITGGNSHTFTNNTDATYFVVSLGNANNGQVLKLVISYSTAAAVPATEVNVTAAGGATQVLIGGTLQLSAAVSPSGASQVVTWTSNKPAVATVNATNGLVTGVGAGNVTITATSSTPGVSGSISLTVPDPIVYDGFEGFEDFKIGTSYTNGEYTSPVTGVKFNYYAARDEELFPIDGKGIMLRRVADDSRLDFTLANGLSAIKFNWIKAFTGAGDRQLEIFVNGVSIGTTPAKDEAGVVQTFEFLLPSPVSGSTTVSIKNIKSTQVNIDNLEWKNGPAQVFGTLDHISLNTDFVKKAYYESEQLTLAGLVVIAYDTNGKDKNVSGDITSSPVAGYTFTTADGLAGTKTITISYTEGKTVSESFSVTVLPIVQPTHLISNVGLVHSAESDSGTAIELGTELKGVFTGAKSSLLESAIVQTDGEDTFSRIYYAGTNNIKGGVQPLKFGASGGKGSVKFTFTKEITITKVTLYAARFTTGATNATLQVNAAAVQNIGAASTIDAMHAPYIFTGEFGNEITIRNNTNIAAYLFGIDIEYTLTPYGEAKAFSDYLMTFPGGNIVTANCEDNFIAARLEWDELTPEAKAEFKSHADFAEARQRLAHWAFVNGVYSLDDLDSNAGNFQADKGNSVPLSAAIIIGILGLTSIVGYYFLQKKKEA